MGDDWGTPIAIAHANQLRNAFVKSGKKAWCYFVPFLCAFSLPPNRILRVYERNHCLFLLVERPDGIDFLCPPVPFDGGEFEAVLEALKALNGDRATRILWVDEDDAKQLDPARFEIQDKDDEYLYDPSLIAQARGKAFRDVRKRVNRFKREHTVTFRGLVPQDIEACHTLLRHWRKRQGRRHPFLLDWGYTRAALDAFGDWDSEFIMGWGVEVDGMMKAFALAGEMLPDVAQFFVAKTDPEIWGLSEYLRWRVYQELSAYALVNDAGDLGLDGLKQFKMKFRPVARLQVFSATVRKEGL